MTTNSDAAYINPILEAKTCKVGSGQVNCTGTVTTSNNKNRGLFRIEELNNEGADFLERGDLKSAAKAFNEAFMKAKAHLRNANSSGTALRLRTPPKSIQNQDSVRRCQRQEGRRQTQQSQQSQQQHNCATNQEVENAPSQSRQHEPTQPMADEFLLYSKPIRFDIVSDEILLICPKGNSTKSVRIASKSMPKVSVRSCIISIVLTFNVAITQHLFAIRTFGPKRRAQLMKALSMYDLCHAKRAKNGISWDILYSMGLINNIGLIHFELGNKATSGRFFEFLLSMCIAEHSTIQPPEFPNWTVRAQLGWECPIRHLFRKNAAHVMVMTRAGAPMA